MPSEMSRHRASPGAEIRVFENEETRRKGRSLPIPSGIHLGASATLEVRSEPGRIQRFLDFGKPFSSEAARGRKNKGRKEKADRSFPHI